MSYKIAIISPEKSPYSATFIKAHIEQIEGDAKHLYGIFFPQHSVDGKYKLKESVVIKKIFVGRKRFIFPNLYRKFFLNTQLKKYLQKENIQVVLAEFGPVGAEVCDVCKDLNLPLIVHFHGFDAYNYSAFKRYGEKYQEMFRYASYLIVVSSDMQRQLLDKGASTEKIILNPYGPRDDFFHLQPNFNEIIFLAVGRFVEKKAPHLTLQAFKKAHAKVPEAKLMMVGNGRLWEACKEWVKEEGLEKVVTFLGAISHEQVLHVFEKAYCFVQHSVVASNGDSEGTPVAILEASAVGLPVVATRHAGIKDVIVHGETGFLVKEHDVDSMADYMIKIANDALLAQKLGKQGQLRVKEKYTMRQHISTLNYLVERSLNNNTNAAYKKS
jgi:colanic acid/amylovoran biosynthesis glycosyltransferase